MSALREMLTDGRFAYIMRVNRTYLNQPEVREEFVAIVNAMTIESRDIEIAISRITALFHEHPDLIDGFIRYIVPRPYPGDEPSEPRQVIIASKYLGKGSTSAQASLTDYPSRSTTTHPSSSLALRPSTSRGGGATSSQAFSTYSPTSSTTTTPIHPSLSYLMSLPSTSRGGGATSSRAFSTYSPTSSTTTTPIHPSSSLLMSLPSRSRGGGATSSQAFSTYSPTSSTTRTLIQPQPSCSLLMNLPSRSRGGGATSPQASLTDPTSSTTTTPTHPRRSSRLKRPNPETSQDSSPEKQSKQT